MTWITAIKPGPIGDLSTPESAKLNDSVAWVRPKSGSSYPTELAYDGGSYILANNGVLTRLDAKTGEQIYKARISDGGDFSSSPWGYKGKVFCLNEEGKTFVIRAGEKYELWIRTTWRRWLWQRRLWLTIG